MRFALSRRALHSSVLMHALDMYRARFKPNGWPSALTQPHAMVAVNVVCADTDDEANYPFTSLQRRFLGTQTGKRGPLPKPISDAEMNALGSQAERASMEQMLTVTAVGSPTTVRTKLDTIIAQTQADELIIAGAVHDHAARMRSYELVAGIVWSVVTTVVKILKTMNARRRRKKVAANLALNFDLASSVLHPRFEFAGQ